MSWNLKIIPRGLLLSKYVKNIVLVNPDSIKDVDRNSLISDQYQTFNQASNTANIVFQLALFNNDPQNESSAPGISGINYIQISNDPEFNDVYTAAPIKFSSEYNLNTNYSVDLNSYITPSTTLPTLQSITFTTQSGIGNINVLNWPLSGSSGAKKVYIAVNVTLSNGDTATYPQGLDIFDEITVCSSIIASPNTPEAINATVDNFAGSPLYYEADSASNAGTTNNDDSGVASYFWDGLILNSTSNLARNNYSQEGLQLFKTANVLSAQKNQENLPISFSTSSVQPSWSSSFYRTYRSATPFKISATDNIYFFEAFVNNNQNTLNYISGSSFFYEFNISSSTGATKYLRQQLAFDNTFKTVTVYTSVDDTSWSSDPSNVPSAFSNTVVITNPDIVAQITGAGIFTTLVELLSSSGGIYQSKLIFKPQNSKNNIVVSESFFSSSLLNTIVNIYGEFRFYIQNATYNIILESTQYGICRGTISAAVMPNDKINTNYSLPVENNTASFYDSQSLNTWFTLNNSPSSGVTNNATVSGFPTVQFYNNQENDSENNISATEIQSSIPTFSNEVTLTASFNLPTTNPKIINTAYSFDSNLDFEDFVFDDLLKTSAGVTLPQSNSKYNYYAAISYSGSNDLELNVFDVGTGQTCSITTSATSNLFFYSQENNTGNLTPPLVVRSVGNLSTSATFSAWIGTSEPFNYSTSALITNLITVQNQGNVPISINTGVGLGINTVAPGEPYVTKLSSITASSPNTFIILSNNSAITSGVNFLYDFGQQGTITELNFTVQIVTPPECPSSLPSFKYSIEVSSDFINWSYVSPASATDVFSPTTGNVKLTFALNQTNCRYARIRIYYDVAVTFDPRNTYRYSSLSGTQTPNSLAANTGKFILGFTDTSAKNSSLGQLYNQPTYMRQFYTNSSTYASVIFDFSDYQNDIAGPVYLSLLTNNGEERFHTVNSGFNLGLTNTHVVTLSVSRKGVNDAFYLQPRVTLAVNNSSTPLVFELDDVLSEPGDTQDLIFGYYPFFSLVGNGNIYLRSSVIKGTYNASLDYSKNKTYFSLFSSENSDYTASYGKNILRQNTYDISTFDYPLVNTFFQYNTIKGFYYENVTFTVRAVITSPSGLFGPAYTDGVYLQACDYVLLAGQLDKSSNGVYQVQARQWVKKKANPSGSGKAEPTVLVSEGNVFGDTLWMQDVISTEWLSNTIACPFVLDNNTLLNTGISSIYKYPQFIKLGVGVKAISQISSLNQVRLKLLNSPAGYVRETDLATQWNSVFQNGELYNLQEKSNSNNTIFMNFAISSSQISGISTSLLPSTYNMLVSFSGNFAPAITNNSDFILPDYGSSYRLFTNPELIYQLFSTYESITLSAASTSIVNTSVYGLSVSNIKTPQTGFSTDVVLDDTAPVVGILSKAVDNAKSVYMSISTAVDTGAGLSIARIIQKNPAGETLYGSWFGFNTNSFSGISSVVAYPSFVANQFGVTTGEPLSGYYRYSLQVADRVGNISQTNSVESFYYESALVDTQGPSAAVNFVNSDTFSPISFTTSSIITTQLLAQDSLSDVKAFRYRILPSGDFGNWLDYNEFAQVFLPESIEDGILSVQFQFKDYGNNVLYSTATISGEQVYIYTWNMVSKLIANVLFTVIESTIFNDNPVLIIGASKSDQATLYVWDNSKLIELTYPGLLGCKAITAMLAVDGKVIIATENGRTFVYENGIMTGPFASFTWGGTTLSISKFETHKYPEESISYVYATTLNIPRIYRTPVDNLKNLSWQVVQTPPISVDRIDVLNSGLWSGTGFSYSISSSYQAATLTPGLLYGISSVIVTNSGSNINSIPTITVGGPMTGVGLSPVLQGYISKLNLLSGGIGYTAGATVTIQAPAAGGVQATGIAITNSNGTITSVRLNSGGQGYGYTNTNPLVTISGNLGVGSQATASSSTQFDSIYSINVTSAGIGTTSSITLSSPGGAVLTPSFLYRVNQLNITSPGFGYTNSPSVLVNGLSTIASATAEYGSIQSVTVIGSAATFPATLAPDIQLSGGVATNWVGAFSTSSISFSTGALNTFPGFVLSQVSVSESGFGLGVVPSISFSTSPIYNPEFKFILSDDITLYSASGSIYDIKSFDNKLFFTSSTNGIVKLGLSSGIFSATQIELNTSANNFNALSPYQLSSYNSGLGTNLFFSISGQPLIGRVDKSNKEYVFQSYKDNILIFKPYNFDILSNWQLKKIISTNGVGTVSHGSSADSLLIYSQNAQVFYESTKDNTWFNRCQTSSNYMVTLNFEAIEGTQSLEISTFDTTLKAAFTFVPVINTGIGTTNNAGQNNLASYDVDVNSLVISYGNQSYQQIIIDAKDIYSITFVKSANNLFVYNDQDLIAQQNNFFTSIGVSPIIKFGTIFEPTTLIANNQSINTFGVPETINTSNFIWKQIKFSFNIENIDLGSDNYSLSIPYVVPNSAAVRVLKTIDNNLYAVTKSLNDSRFTSMLPDVGSKVFRMGSDIWTDVTGNFETYNSGDSTSYIITSPNDIGNLNKSFFITGVTKTIQSRSEIGNILAGLSTSIVYEQAENATLVIIFPRNANPSGQSVLVSSSNSLIYVPGSVYFPSDVFSKVISVGVGSTANATSAIISVTDGISTSQSPITVFPIGISSIGLNTSSFVAYSDDQVIANIQLNAITQSPVTINLNSTDSSRLRSPLGIVTVPAGSIGIITSLSVGLTTSIQKNISIIASYRSTSGIATITALPFSFSFSVNNRNFVGNQGVTTIGATASINRSPIGVLTVNLNSTGQTILGAPTSAYIFPSTFSTSQVLSVGSAVTQNTNIFITALIPGSVSTSLSTAAPFIISSAVSDLPTPVFGLQTATVTFTINSAPLSNLLIRNIVTSTTMLNTVFPSFSTIFAGSSTTSFGVSTGLQYGQGLAITVQGAPLGFNTSPTPALTMLNDRWRVTNLIVSPNNIVGGSAYADGSVQQFGVTATLNVGLATTVYISSSSTRVDTRNISFGTSGTGAATSTGYSTGLSTTAITGFAITAVGPYGITTTATGLTLNPFLISSFSTSYIWNGVATQSPAYIVGGIGATAVATITLNAYVLTGLQTVLYSTIGTFITRPGFATLGVSSILIGSNSTSIFLTSLRVPSSFTTSVTARLVGDGISTAFINVQPIPSYFAVFDPIVSGSASRLYLFPSAPLPISQGVAVTYSNGVTGNISLNANVTGIATEIPFRSFGLSTTFKAEVQTLGITQTYYVTGYNTSGNAFSVGYNYYGELSKNYPVIGPLIGSADRVYMGLSSVLKTASGYHHNLALDSKGEVFSIGLNTYNQLGYLGASTNIFYQVGLPTTFKVRDIFAQRNSSYVITADNNLYAWGGNNLYALGTSTISISTSMPRLVDTNVQLFSAYEDNAAYVTFNNQTGIQSVFQFGAGRTIITGFAITQLAIFGSSRPISNLIISVLDQGPNHTVAGGTWTDTATGLSSSGVFAWGANSFYQTGFTSTLGVSTVPNILIGFNTFNQKALIPYNQHIIADYNFSLVEGAYTPTNQSYISQVQMQTLGIGYTAAPLITFSSPPNSIVSVTAIGTATLNNLGQVRSTTVLAQGSGYVSGAGVTFSDPTGITSNPVTALGTAIVSGNQVVNIHITNPGFGYTSPPLVIISPVSGGGGAIGIASIVQGQITGIIITNPGFGYTQSAVVTIGTSAGTHIGSGATALVELASSSVPVTNFTIVGAAISSNSSGFGLGFAATNVGRTLSANTPDINLTKIIKNPLHYYWLNANGTAIASGGAIPSVNFVPASISNSLVYLFPANNSGLENSELYSYVPSIIGQVNGLYTYRVFGNDFVGTTLQPLNFSLQPHSFIGAYTIDSFGGFAASVDTGNYLNVFYHDTENEVSESWIQAAQLPGFVDMTLAQADVTQVDPRAKRIYVTTLQGSATNTTISIYIGNVITETQSQNFNTSPVQVFVARGNPTKIASAYISHYRGEYFTHNGVTYDWVKSDVNITIGYQDGTIELYGNATHYTVDGGIVLISSWSPNGNPITALDSICDWQFPNLKYLFAGTSNGQIYCYQGDGDTLDTYIQSQLSITQSPVLLNTLTLPAFFGYAKDIQNFIAGVVMASTSTNKLVFIRIQDLSVIGYISVPGVITSMTSTVNSENAQLPVSLLTDTPVACVTALAGGVVTPYEYYATAIQNYEMSLDYANIAGAYQAVTIDGTVVGAPMTSIVDISTNDTFTIIVDSSNPAI
jgi:hypothetical protein